jgi:hypothetical protein
VLSGQSDNTLKKDKMNIMRKKTLIILGIILIIVFVLFFAYLQFRIDWEKDRFVGEWADPKLEGDNWAFFPDRSFAIQVTDIWRSDGSYDVKAGKLFITMPENRGSEEYYYSFSNNDRTLTLYLINPPADVYRVYNKL